MPFYLTRDPVPSADMRNVFDNAQNLDLALNDLTSSLWTDRLGRSRMSWFGLESAFSVKLSDFESRFTSQIVEQEATFDASQADKENRFQHFLVSSGYVFLGDYEDGPFQFSARNQYIRYDNQYYRLNAATDVGFTTTGTDATSFVNDVTHFVLMDGDTLRQNLGSGDGLKLVGRCANVALLRTTEPTQNIQLIRTVSYSTGLAPDMPRGGSDYEYDPDDTTTADDGILTIVTSDGARWKKILNDLSLTCADAGVFPSGDDDTDALNALFTVVASFWWTRGRFRLDMMGLKFRSSKGNAVEFDPNRIELVDFTIENTLYETTTAFAIVRCRPTIPFQSGVEFVKGNVERLRIKDATRRTNSPVTALHLTSDVNGAFSSVIFNELNISSPKYGIAFGNHCYLVTFNGGSCTADKDLVTSIKAGLESSLTDMGENYLFNGYGFHGGKALEWSDVGAEFNFVSCKFDFVMLGSNTASGTVVNVDGGHVEFNNSYARWFETTKPAHVRFYPAWLVCDGTNATTDHLFYDDTGTSMLNVDSNVAYWSGTAVKSMINTRLLSDKSNSLQGLQPAVRGDLNKYLVDGAFTRSTLVDRWYADMNASRTDRLTTDTTTLTRGTTNDASGNTFGCLTIVKKSTVGEGFSSGAQLVVKVPRGTTPAHIKFKYKATTEGVPVVITARLVTVLTFDSNGIPVFGDRVITSAATTVTAGTTAAEYRSSTGLNVVQDYMAYDYVQLSISLFNVPTGGAEVKIYDVLINKIG
ncbi:hypothetical protein [Klebsiella pneumoniae]|uniref:hypothetical protein n=2 Tax=Klebsiella pneumoniae TaxID=573 RepID=UPI0023DB2FC3|nr:hypothetical protein [Klebsiella pneumoniae]MDF1985193.1 hypothetical protein [Klebsiella pneumoniae]HBQ5200946.1 hypothetical protein [Klebsiella pneumoniae]HBQ5340205.1 hypothetical protein [Klebsiella pneumoniae]HBQ5349856.1 hypothetical protein [Klebsiella pneumoniae]HBQ5374338.1 hypothetical protein [Klebsiella pneumoniae]